MYLHLVINKLYKNVASAGDMGVGRELEGLIIQEF
jgi:hypothetical protein